MRKVLKGKHTRKMLLCRVARGRVLATKIDMPGLQGAAPAGYNSVHGYAGRSLNYDEFVVFEEAAVLPHAIVEYQYTKGLTGAE